MISRSLLFLTLCLFLVSFPLSKAAIKEDQVTGLPEWPNFSDASGGAGYFTMYSGYLRFESYHSESQRNIHYVFMESLNDPSNDPVVIWLNGGPGCSSMEGMIEEVGPFVFPVWEI